MNAEGLNKAALLLMSIGEEEAAQVFKYLAPREAEILTLRFGLDGQSPRTLEQVGKRFKVTRERVRQIQEIALRKLRRRVEASESTNTVGKS